MSFSFGYVWIVKIVRIVLIVEMVMFDIIVEIVLIKYDSLSQSFPN